MAKGQKKKKKNLEAEEKPKQRKARQYKKKEYKYTADEDLAFQARLGAKNLRFVEVCSDGNCLFRAVSLQLFGTQSQHWDLRQTAVDTLEENEEDFAPFVDGPFSEYCETMRSEGEWGGQMEIMALAKAFSRKFVIHHLEGPSYVLGSHKEEIHLSYHDGSHYNAVRCLEDDCSTAALPIVFDPVSESYEISNQQREPLVEITKTKGKKKEKKERRKKTKNKMKPEVSAQVVHIQQATGLDDVPMIEKTLKDMEEDVEATIEYLCSRFEIALKSPSAQDKDDIQTTKEFLNV